MNDGKFNELKETLKMHAFIKRGGLPITQNYVVCGRYARTQSQRFQQSIT